MNNEKLEGTVSGKKNSSKVLFIVLGLIVLGIVSLFAGIKIFSKLSISADTLPPIPGDPLDEPTVTTTSTTTTTRTATVTASLAASSTATASATSTPPGPGDPVGPPIDLTIKAGWSMISGTTLFNFDVSPITNAGMYFYSFNDPYLASRSWIVSSPTCSAQKDFFCTSLNQKFSPIPYTGYYLYNPGSQKTVTLNQVSRLSIDPKNAIYSRGWHLLHWAGASVTKEELFKNSAIQYSNDTVMTLAQATSAESHQASVKIYVIMDSSSINSSTIKELTTTDSDTTISKIPQNSYFWVYIRRTQSRATGIGLTYSSTSLYPPALPNVNAINNYVMPPVPPAPN